MYNNLEHLFTALFGAMFGIMESGAQSLFLIGIYSSLFFILLKVFGAMQSGGGASMIQAIGLQIFIFYAVVGTVAFLIGMIISPWFSNFAMEVVKMLAGALVFKIAVGAFVGIAGLVATFALNYINGLHPGQLMSGPDMLYVGMVTFVFAVMAVLVPGAIAWRIAGGVPIFQLGNLIGAVRSGAATMRLR
jgi:hypothetical protein